MMTWTFVTNHSSVLAIIAEDREITAREIAVRLNITERSVRRILADLESEGYIDKKKVGRVNRYTVRHNLPLRSGEPMDGTVGDLLKVKGMFRSRRSISRETFLPRRPDGKRSRAMDGLFQP